MFSVNSFLNSKALCCITATSDFQHKSQIWTTWKLLLLLEQNSDNQSGMKLDVNEGPVLKYRNE